jgi:hypothetical protein
VASAVQKILAAVPEAKLESMTADNGTAEGSARTLAAFPEVDILVNNLGIYEAVGFFEESDEDWRRLFEVNILSGVRLSRHYLQGMLKRNWVASFSSPANPASIRPRKWPLLRDQDNPASPLPQPCGADQGNGGHRQLCTAWIDLYRQRDQIHPGCFPWRSRRGGRKALCAAKPEHLADSAPNRPRGNRGSCHLPLQPESRRHQCHRAAGGRRHRAQRLLTTRKITRIQATWRIGDFRVKTQTHPTCFGWNRAEDPLGMRPPIVQY